MASILTIRATSQAPIDFQLLDGGNPIDLTGFTVELRLSDNTGATKSFNTTDSPAKLAVVDAVNGKLRLFPDTPDFASATIYYGFFWIIDGSGKRHAVSENENFSITVIPDF
ncbi:MAG TPA: BppU family phage baseplate upper protein [Candidatus Hypogeohydataceae bacterium YC41]